MRYSGTKTKVSSTELNGWVAQSHIAQETTCLRGITRSGSGCTVIAAVERLGEATCGTSAGSDSLMSVTLGPFGERRMAPRPCRDSAARSGYASAGPPRHSRSRIA